MKPGPSHNEVQYWWSQSHLLRVNVVTLVTTRSSCSIELNCKMAVQLMHIVIHRSALHGSPISTEAGKIDTDILHKNLSTAIYFYIQRPRCDGASCGHTEIRQYRGANCDQDM